MLLPSLDQIILLGHSKQPMGAIHISRTGYTSTVTM